MGAWYGHRALVEELLTMGAPVDAKKGWYDYTALHWAAERGYKEVVECLLDRGADIDCKDGCDDIPLHWADIDGICEYGRTPLRIATFSGHTEIATLLRDRGA